MAEEEVLETPAEMIQLPAEVDLLNREVPGSLIGHKFDREQLYLLIDRALLPQAVQALKDDSELAYDYFSECLGVDYSTWEHARDFTSRFEVVYNLMSVGRAARIFLKVGVDDGEFVPTLKHVFIGAEYPEREVWDMFGVIFEGNEQTQRFLLPDDWIGHPLRKEYPLGGEDVLFDRGERGPAVEDVSMPHAGESFVGRTGSEDVSGR